MKAFKSILVLTFMLLTFDVSARSLPEGFVFLEPGNPEYDTFVKIRSRAIELIVDAGINPGNNLNSYAIAHGEVVIRSLRSATFVISTNSRSETRCGDNAFFVNSDYQNVIFICGESRSALRDPNPIDFISAAQLLIHEGSHLADYSYSENDRPGYKSSECETTYFELIIMENNFGKYGIPSMDNRDAYKAECEFVEYDDVPSKK